MSATNSTTHYSLPSFLGSDKPAWLVDWNGAMATIDSAIYEAKQAADTASASASAVASDLATLSGTVSTQGTSISTLSDTLTTAVGNINTINGNITTINSLIGNGTPTTTDQTIIGAINEINAKVNDLAYSSVSVTADGTKTYSQLLDNLYAAFTAVSGASIFGSILEIDGVIFQLAWKSPTSPLTLGYSRAGVNLSDGAETTIISLISSSSVYERGRGTTRTDLSATVPTSGTTIKIHYQKAIA